MVENFPNVTQWPCRRVFDQYREEAEFAPVIPFDDNARVTERIFVQGRPWQLDVGAPEFRKFVRCERVSLYKNGSPPRPIATGGPCTDNRLQRHQPLHRNRGDRRGKMQQINYRTPRQGQRNEFSAQSWLRELQHPGNQAFGVRHVRSIFLAERFKHHLFFPPHTEGIKDACSNKPGTTCEPIGQE